MNKFLILQFCYFWLLSCSSRAQQDPGKSNAPGEQKLFRVVSAAAGRDEVTIDELGSLEYLGAKPLETTGLYIVFALAGDSAKQINFTGAATLNRGNRLTLIEPAPNFIPTNWKGKKVNISVSRMKPETNVSELLWYTAITLN